MASDSVFRFLRVSPPRLLTSCAILLLLFAQISYGAPQEPPAVAVVTDQTSVSLSDKVFAQSVLGLKANGDVFFGTSSSLFYWSSISGTRTRLLQVNDPIPGFPGSVATSVASPLRLNSAGHAALLDTWAAPGVRDPNGIFIYDGSTNSKVVLSGEAVPGLPGFVFSTIKDLRVNANDQVAFVSTYQPGGEYMLGVFLGSPSGPPSKIATTADLNPLVGQVDNIYLIGVDDSGDVAFLCENVSNPFSGYSVVIGSPSGTLHAIRFQDAAPGTNGQFSLPSSLGSYAFNSGGDLAFFSNVWNDPSVFAGIWVRTASGTIQKLVANGDATGTGLGGTYSSFAFRGFNDSGQVLYTAGVSGGTAPLALFLNSVGGSPAVLCYVNQTLSGGSQAINGVALAVLNAGGKAAVIANLRNPGGRALLLCSASAGPQVIVLEGSATPAGGTYAQISTARINDANQVVFRSDILPLNTNGLFFWASGSGVQTIVTTADTVMSDANSILDASGTVASDDEMVFWPYKAQGKDTIFTKSLHPGTETIRRVIGDGDTAPTGGMLAYINNPAINDKEELVVFASVIGGTPYPADALWLSKPGTALQKLVMTNDAAPGSAGGQFSGFPSQARINNSSQAAFYANLKNASSNSSSGVFLISASGTIYSIARVGDVSPAGGTFRSFSNTVYLSDTGQVAFRATSQNGNSQTDGLFAGSATAAPVKLMAVGDSWGGGVFSNLGAAFKMNKAGQVVFWADLSFTHGGIFAVSPGTSPIAIALGNNNTPTPGSFLEFRFPEAYLDINSSGQVAFWGVYATDTTGAYGTGYFVGSATTPPTARVSMGQVLPGGGSCPLLLPVAGGFALADSGELAVYIPNVSGGADLPRYVIAGKDGTLRPFAAVGDAAGDAGGVFGRLGLVTANSTGGFFIGATLVEGSAKQAIFRAGLAMSSLTASVGFPAPVWTPITWTAVATGGVAPFQYQFWRNSGGAWAMVQDYSAANTYTWTPTPSDIGSHAIEVRVRNAGSTAQSDATLQAGFTVIRRAVSDANGDGASDAIVWRAGTRTWYARHSGTGAGATTAVHWDGYADGDIQVPADYDGDGKIDLAVWRPSTGYWYILKSSESYNVATILAVPFGSHADGDVPVPGDYDGDGKAEIAVFRQTTGEWLIEGQGTPTHWGMKGDIPAPADYNGDGIMELAVFRPTTGVWYVQGGETLEWGMWGDVPVAADYNGDGKADIAVYRPSTGWWYVARGPMVQWGTAGDVPVPLDTNGDGATEFVVYRPSDGTWYVFDPINVTFNTVPWGQAGDVPVGIPPQLPSAPVLKTAGDFDHDGSADITVFRPSTGGWYTLQSTRAYREPATVLLGQSGDIPVPGDYQGTGAQERAVYRPSTGQWLLGDGRTFTLGAPDDVPVPADYDGDGIMDLAVFTPGTGLWSILTGASGFTTLVTQSWGFPGDVPAPGDYDGDGKADLAVFTPATGQWSVRSSLSGTTLITVAWGMSGDILVPGDYDRDGKTDIAVYRPSTGYWYVLTSSSSWSNFQWYWWGAVGDIPVPGDFDGDGKTDVAVYRPSTGTWYVMNVLTIVGWGEAADAPILSRR